MSQDPGKDKEKGEGKGLLKKLKKAVTPTAAPPKQPAAKSQQGLKLDLTLKSDQQSNTGVSQVSPKAKVPLPQPTPAKMVSHLPRQCFVVRLILSQPHSTMVIRRDIILNSPLESFAFDQIIHAADEILRNSTVVRMNLNVTLGAAGKLPPIEVAVTLGGRTIPVRSQRDLVDVVKLFSLRSSTDISVTELRVRISCPPSVYDIVPPRNVIEGLQVLETSSGGPEERDFAAITPSSLMQQPVRPIVVSPTSSEPLTPSTGRFILENGQMNGRSRKVSGGDDITPENGSRLKRQNSFTRSISSSIAGRPHSSCCSGRAESVSSSVSSTPEGRSSAARTLITRLCYYEPPIGRGAFGTVYRCVDRETGRDYALKIISLHSGDTTCLTRLLSRFEEEVQLMSQLRHLHIVTYYGSVVHTGGLYIVMEYLPSGSVRDLINRIGGFLEGMTRRFGRQCLSGLSYLHRRRIAHLDLRCSNLLLVNGKLKVADFGCSRMLSDIATAGGTRTTNDSSQSTLTTLQPQQSQKQQMAASPAELIMAPAYWLSPEVALGTTPLISGRVSQTNFWQLTAADIWSFGCVLVEMATEWPPFYKRDQPNRDELEILVQVARENYPDFTLPKDASPELDTVLRLIFVRDPASRPTAEDLKHVPFFRREDSC